MKTINRYFICFILFCFTKQAYSQNYLKLIDTKKSKTYTILPCTVLTFTSSKRFFEYQKKTQVEYRYHGTFRYMEDSNLVFTLVDKSSISGIGIIPLSKCDTTLYKFNLNDIKRIKINYPGVETFWETWIFVYSLAYILRPAVIIIDNTHAADGYKFLMEMGSAVVTASVDIFATYLISFKTKKVNGKRYKFEIHPIEKSKIYAQPN